MSRASLTAVAVPIEGRLVRLRPAGLDDAPAFAALLADPTVDARWQSADVTAEARELAAQEDDLTVWAIEHDGEVVGLIQAYEETEPRYRHAAIDVALRADAQGRGLGTDAVRTLARWLLRERGHHRLTIDPAADNERAIRTYARVGFRPVGLMRRYEGDRDGSWHDGLLMDLLAEELLEEPTTAADGRAKGPTE